MAATLWGGDNSATSHGSASGLLQLRDLRLPGMHLTIAADAGGRLPGDILNRSTLTRVEQVSVDGIRCTAATRTLVDCAGEADAESLEAAFEAARRMGLTSVEAVARSLGRGRPGSAKMRWVLAHAAARPKESRLEVKLAQLLRESGLPAAEPQVPIGASRVDFAWRRYRLVCECDGFEWHGDRLRWKRDRRRIAAIEAAGFRVVHVMWEDVTKHPAETIDRLALALRDAA
jgi:very-short-patch-repair endonuclease